MTYLSSGQACVRLSLTSQDLNITNNNNNNNNSEQLISVYFMANLPSFTEIYSTCDKLKAKLSLCVIQIVPRHEDVWRSKSVAPPFLISVLDGVEWSASRHSRFTPGERASGTHWLGDLRKIS
jgi:hypothetical protein